MGHDVSAGHVHIPGGVEGFADGHLAFCGGIVKACTGVVDQTIESRVFSADLLECFVD